MADATSRSEIFFTDKQLCERWQCSHMKLWRLRKRGALQSTKVGGVGNNLTALSIVKQLEKSTLEPAA